MDDNNRVKTFKLLCNWKDPQGIYTDTLRFSKNNRGLWNNLQMSLDEKCDYYVIINKYVGPEYYEPKKTIVFRMEPDTETNKYWDDWFQSKDDFMFFMDLSKFRNNNEWHLNFLYNDKNVCLEKTKNLSTVVSSMYFSEGHIKRINFLKYLESNNTEIDIFGRENKFCFKNYKHSLPYMEKNIGIIPYKYTIAVENCELKNYYTEKIIDAIVGESLCFYWGCANIETFIDPRCFIRLDLNDFEKSQTIIKTVIENKEWEKRIEFIKKEKEKIIEHYTIYPRVESLIYFSTLDIIVVKDKNIENLYFQEQCFKEGIKNYTLITKEEEKDFDFQKETLVLHDDIPLPENFIDKVCFVYRELKEKCNDYGIFLLEPPSVSTILTPCSTGSKNDLIYSHMFRHKKCNYITNPFGISEKIYSCTSVY